MSATAHVDQLPAPPEPARRRRAAWAVAPLLLRFRRADGDARGLLTVLSIAAFAVTQFLLLSVVGGMIMFVRRNAHPLTAWERESGFLYVMLAAFATVLLTVPLLQLGSAAARLDANRRERRLAGLRLLGATPGDVTVLATLEVLRQAAVGVVAGSVLFVATAPLWHALSFQGSAIGYTELLPTPWSLAAVAAGVLLMSLASALTGLRRVRITPLGVARRTSVPEVHVLRLVAAVVIMVAWLVVGGMVGGMGAAVGTLVALGFVAAMMIGVNAAGPYLVKLLGLVMARTARAPARLLAGRRLMQDPHAAWRSMGALALTSFVAGCTILLPSLSANGATPQDRIFASDITTGALLTLAIAFVITAASTGIAQASEILARADDARTLALTGAPLALHGSVRRHEVLWPIALAVVPAAGASLLFQFPLIGVSGMAEALKGIGILAGAIAVGVALVVVAEEACGPLQRRVVGERRRRAD